jgi:hypothetical protein
MKMLRYLQIPILSFPCKWESRKRYFKKAWIPAGVYSDENRGRSDKKGGQTNIGKFKIAFSLQPPRYDHPEV